MRWILVVEKVERIFLLRTTAFARVEGEDWQTFDVDQVISFFSKRYRHEEEEAEDDDDLSLWKYDRQIDHMDYMTND